MADGLMSRIHASIPICVDGRMLVPGATGVSSYATALVEATRRIGGRPMVLLSRDRGTGWRLAVAAATGMRRAVASGDGELTGDELFRAAQVRFRLYRRFTTVWTDLSPGIMHWTYPVPLRMAGWINLYTVHDVVPLDHPELSPVDSVRLRAILSRIVNSGDRIITVSETSRARIVAQLGIAPGRVTTCYQSLTAAGFDEAPLPDGLIADGYFLFCGLIEPRKNLVRLIAAHARSGTTLPLVLTGPPTPAGDRATADAIAAGVAAGQVRRLGYVAADVLATLQRQARALLFPSLGEGFGLPVLEAMRIGTPVLTSNSGALAEVAGQAALMVDPENVDAITAGIRRIADDAMLRANLSDAGRRQAERFTAARFAARLRAVYSDALAERTAGRMGTVIANRD